MNKFKKFVNEYYDPLKAQQYYETIILFYNFNGISLTTNKIKTQNITKNTTNKKEPQLYKKHIFEQNDHYSIQKNGSGALYGFYPDLKDAEFRVEYYLLRQWKNDFEFDQISQYVYQLDKFYVFKSINDEIKELGSFNTLDEALKYVKILKENNWQKPDEKEIKIQKEKNNIIRRKPRKNKTKIKTRKSSNTKPIHTYYYLNNLNDEIIEKYLEYREKKYGIKKDSSKNITIYKLIKYLRFRNKMTLSEIVKEAKTKDLKIIDQKLKEYKKELRRDYKQITAKNYFKEILRFYEFLNIKIPNIKTKNDDEKLFKFMSNDEIIDDYITKQGHENYNTSPLTQFSDFCKKDLQKIVSDSLINPTQTKKDIKRFLKSKKRISKDSKIVYDHAIKRFIEFYRIYYNYIINENFFEDKRLYPQPLISIVLRNNGLL